VGVPRHKAAPVIHDFATTKLALGKVRVAMQSGQPVPPDVLIDSAGRPTQDPRVMFEADAAGKLGAMLAFGGHKGFGMALVCELLGGALTGGAPCMRPRISMASTTICCPSSSIGALGRRRAAPGDGIFHLLGAPVSGGAGLRPGPHRR
jgi:hypothetical protein